MKLYLIPVIVFLFSTNLLSQIEFNEESQIARLESQFMSLNKSSEYFSGWRIQIISSDNRRKVENEKYTFQSKYDRYSLISKFSNPYYKLQVGAFATKLEAERVKYLLKKDYPSAYLVKDKEIDPMDLF